MLTETEQLGYDFLRHQIFQASKNLGVPKNLILKLANDKNLELPHTKKDFRELINIIDRSNEKQVILNGGVDVLKAATLGVALSSASALRSAEDLKNSNPEVLGKIGEDYLNGRYDAPPAININQPRQTNIYDLGIYGLGTIAVGAAAYAAHEKGYINPKQFETAVETVATFATDASGALKNAGNALENVSIAVRETAPPVGRALEKTADNTPYIVAAVIVVSLAGAATAAFARR